MPSRTVAGGRARSARPPEPRILRFPTTAAVAEGIHAAWHLIRDALQGRPTISHVDRWSRASRATTGYPPCRHPATVPRYVNRCASTVRTPLFLARRRPQTQLASNTHYQNRRAPRRRRAEKAASRPAAEGRRAGRRPAARPRAAAARAGAEAGAEEKRAQEAASPLI